MPVEGWSEEDEALLAMFPLRVHRHGNKMVCSCVRYDRTGRCPHLVPYREKEDVDVKEEYL